MLPARMPPQLSRLVLLAVVVSAGFAIARVALTPSSFGQYGHYRGAALEEIAARDPAFAGAKACDECHGDVRDKLARYEHRGIGCESCHAPARRHANDPDVTTTKLTNATCIRCHAANSGRPAWLKQIKDTDHFTGDRCVECHMPHQPKESP